MHLISGVVENAEEFLPASVHHEVFCEFCVCEDDFAVCRLDACAFLFKLAGRFVLEFKVASLGLADVDEVPPKERVVEESSLHEALRVWFIHLQVDTTDTVVSEPGGLCCDPVPCELLGLVCCK